MTKLTPGHPLIRETQAFEQVDPLIVEAHATHLVIRVKGKRDKRVQVSYQQLMKWGNRLPGGTK